MIVLISDLHFCDGTAYASNVGADAFVMLMREALSQADRHRVKELHLVLLGDVFDLLRTEAWFDLPPAERPWGDPATLGGTTPPAAAMARAHQIAEQIIRTNQPALDVLAGRDPQIRALLEASHAPLEVKRYLMLGNHDRLALHSKALFRRMLEALGASDVSTIGGASSSHRIRLPEYGLLARHGHEWDAWNFERHDPERRNADYEEDDYLCTPLGDPITTELVAALPFRVAQLLRQSSRFPSALTAHIIDRLQRVEDVRPLLSTLRWVTYESHRLQRARLDPKLSIEFSEILTAVINERATLFREMPFYQAWYERHRGSGRAIFFDQFLRYAGRASFAEAAQRAERLRKCGVAIDYLGARTDVCEKGAALEQLGDTLHLRAVVYGHTHEGLTTSLRASASSQDLYLNSGTWRRREFACGAGDGFIGWQQCTWLAFYNANETRNGESRNGPAFESWTGQRKLEDHGDG